MHEEAECLNLPLEAAQAGPHRGCSQIKDREQGAFAFATNNGLGQLQIAPRRRVDFHDRAGGEAPLLPLADVPEGDARGVTIKDGAKMRKFIWYSVVMIFLY